MNTGITGKVAVITGASKGIGKAVALALAAEGARLAVCARDERTLKAAADEIQAHTHADIVAVKANTMKLNDIRRFVAAAEKKFGRIDILVNNAGGWHVGGIFDTTDETWEYHLQMKVLGYIRMAREVIRHMKVNGGGSIVNIVGIAAREPATMHMVPGVTDAAVLNFTRSLSKELAADRIRVNAINPATAETPLTDEILRSLSAILQKSPEELRRSTEQSLQGKLIDPQDIAQAVVFLVSDAARAITGISLNVDAGKLMGVW